MYGASKKAQLDSLNRIFVLKKGGKKELLGEFECVVRRVQSHR